MAFNVNEFRAQLVGDGARPNLFTVSLGFPSLAQDANDGASLSQFMVKSAQLPGSTVGTVPLYYFGRELKFAGNRTFTDWTVTVINDENFSIRNALEEWMSLINSHAGNVRNPGAISGSIGATSAGYTVDSNVIQYGKDGSTVLKQYSFVGMFPVDISPIDLDWGSNDSIEEYSVTFAYQYWTSTGVAGTTPTTDS
jgi:hypothetical protein